MRASLPRLSTAFRFLNKSVLAFVLGAFAPVLLLPLSAAPVVGPEFGFGPASYVAAPYAQLGPAVAFNGTNHLVVWRDYRDGSEYRIYGTRVSPDGQVLDPAGIRLDDGSDVYDSVVASDGSDFMVAWGHANYSTVFATRVLGDGTVSTNVLKLVGWEPSIAFNGTNYLLVWSSNDDIYGMRLDRNGSSLDPAGFPICSDTNSQYSAAVAPLGNNWLVAWTDLRREHYGYGKDGDIYGTLVSSTGTVLFTNGFPICTQKWVQSYPQLSTLGTQCLVTWHDSRNALLGDVFHVWGARVNVDGAVLDPGGFGIGFLGQSDIDAHPATDGQQWVVTWESQTGSYAWQVAGVNVSAQGVAGGGAYWGAAPPSYVSPPVLAWGKTNYFAAWTQLRSGYYGYDIVGSRISPYAARLDTPYPVSLSANPQIQPEAAGDGTNGFLVVWSDGSRGEGQWDIYGALVNANANGPVPAPGVFPITASTTAETNPAVAFNGSRYLVVWVDTRNSALDIYGARVNLDGTVLETNGFPIARGGLCSPAVASNGKDFLVAWGVQSSAAVNCARVSDSGQVLDAPPLGLLTGPYSGDPMPRVAGNGTNYLVIGSPYYGGSVVVSAGGAILYSNFPLNVGRTLAANSGNFLSTYHTSYGVTGLLYNETGAITTNFTLASTFYNNYAYTEAVAGNGQDYILAFNAGGLNDPLSVCQVGSDGALLSSNALAWTQEPVEGLAGNRHNYLLTYVRKNAASPVPRLCARILNGAPNLTEPTFQSRQFTLTLESLAQRICEIEASSDLQNWSLVGRVTNQTGRIPFSEPATLSPRFYRAREIQ